MLNDNILIYPLYTQYVDWVNTSDPNAEWNAEATCGVYKYRRDVDLFKGAFLTLFSFSFHPPLYDRI